MRTIPVHTVPYRNSHAYNARRRRQRAHLQLVGRTHPDGFTIIDTDVPLAYCLPGREGAVVLSSAAVDLLTDDERRLVVGHEHRHLSARHHLPIVLAEALLRTRLDKLRTPVE